MKLIPIKELPMKNKPVRRGRAKSKDIFGMLEEFMETGAKYAKVEYTNAEYASRPSAQASLCRATLDYRYPLYVRSINGDVYIIRTDI